MVIGKWRITWLGKSSTEISKLIILPNYDI